MPPHAASESATWTGQCATNATQISPLMDNRIFNRQGSEMNKQYSIDWFKSMLWPKRTQEKEKFSCAVDGEPPLHLTFLEGKAYILGKEKVFEKRMWKPETSLSSCLEIIIAIQIWNIKGKEKHGVSKSEAVWSLKNAIEGNLAEDRM